jgi:hypothetical protein
MFSNAGNMLDLNRRNPQTLVAWPELIAISKFFEICG